MRVLCFTILATLALVYCVSGIQITTQRFAEFGCKSPIGPPQVFNSSTCDDFQYYTTHNTSFPLIYKVEIISGNATGCMYADDMCQNVTACGTSQNNVCFDDTDGVGSELVWWDVTTTATSSAATLPVPLLMSVLLAVLAKYL